MAFTFTANGTGFSSDDEIRFIPRSKRVLLREPERCAECNSVFLSLYALRSCVEHDGLDEV